MMGQSQRSSGTLAMALLLLAFSILLVGCEWPGWANVCGNELCEEGESATNCPEDCEVPPPEGEYPFICGDGDCSPWGENMITCPEDCGLQTTGADRHPVLADGYIYPNIPGWDPCDPSTIEDILPPGSTFVDEDIFAADAYCGYPMAASEIPPEMLQPLAFCGNGIVDEGEQCEVDTDCPPEYAYCSASCHCVMVCEPGDPCYAAGPGYPCTTPEGQSGVCEYNRCDCVVEGTPVCGDSVLDPSEECEVDSDCPPEYDHCSAMCHCVMVCEPDDPCYNLGPGYPCTTPEGDAGYCLWNHCECAASPVTTDPVCGDGVIESPEDCEVDEDCPTTYYCRPDECWCDHIVCGDGSCSPAFEDSNNCPDDCGDAELPVCGDGVIESPEDCEVDEDCPTAYYCRPDECWCDHIVCGDGACSSAFEDSDNCPDDCECVDDGECNPGEGASCPDCTPPRGDGVCGSPCEVSEDCIEGLACFQAICWDDCICEGRHCGYEEEECEVPCEDGGDCPLDICSCENGCCVCPE